MNFYQSLVCLGKYSQPLSLVLAVSVFLPVHASEDNTEFNIAEIEQGVYVHLGKHVSIEAEGHDDIANTGFIVGDKCIAVIDTGGSVTIGKLLLQAIRSVSDKPVCYVINTHIHYDHLLGNKVFVSESTTFVGHHQLAEAVEQNRGFFVEQFREELGDNVDEASVIGPQMLVEDTQEIDLGNRVLILKAYPVSHSHSDLTILDRQTQTLWSGDLVFRERIPSLTGSLKGWVKVMDELHSLDVKIVIPGHGSIASSIDEALQQQEEYLNRLLDETRQAIAEGKFLNDAVETIDSNNSSKFLLHEYQHPTNVSRAFTELEWE